MSIRHPVAHHLLTREHHRRRRVVVDVLLVCIFLFAIAMVAFVHVLRAHEEEARREAVLRERTLLSDAARALAQRDATREEELRRAREERERGSAVSVFAATSTPSIAPESPQDTLETEATSTSTSTSQTEAQVSSFVRFQDVTATRYENSRLGFIMEIPEGWSEVYTRNDAVVLANSAYWFGVTVPEVTKKKEAMWIHVLRPCTSTEATSTVFAFASTSDTSIREATSCIPPLLVTLGYRADASDTRGREQFLLSIGRTIYPIVSSIPPYLPLR